MTAYLAPSTGLNIILKVTFVTKIKQVLFKFTSSIKVLIVVFKAFSIMFQLHKGQTLMIKIVKDTVSFKQRTALIYMRHKERSLISLTKHGLLFSTSS